VLYKRLIIRWNLSYNLQWYTRRGEDMILEEALTAIKKHESLPPGRAGSFAFLFIEGVNKLNVA